MSQACLADRNKLDVEIQREARERVIAVDRDGLVGHFRNDKVHDLPIRGAALQRHAYLRVEVFRECRPRYRLDELVAIAAELRRSGAEEIWIVTERGLR